MQFPADAEDQLARVMENYWAPQDPHGDIVAGMAHQVMRRVHEWHDTWQDDQRRAVRAEAATAPPPLSVIDATIGNIDRIRLVAGRVVHRYTESRGVDRLTSTVPCCDRKVTLWRDGQEHVQHVVCIHCRLAYAVELVDEGDDGWGNHGYRADFTVEHDVTLARQRASKRA